MAIFAPYQVFVSPYYYHYHFIKIDSTPIVAFTVHIKALSIKK